MPTIFCATSEELTLIAGEIFVQISGEAEEILGGTRVNADLHSFR
jgi:hypothetical protein